MGCFNYKDVVVQRDEVAIEINERIKEDKKQSAKEAKILLLGIVNPRA